MVMKIVNAKHCSPNDWEKLTDIFFEASGIKKFSSNEVKERFYFKYFAYYKKYYLSYFYVLYVSDIAKGYVCGAPSTLDDHFFLQAHPYLKYLTDELIKFPAHLHINVEVSTRGSGAGNKLIHHFIKNLKHNHKNFDNSGLHIVTGIQERNQKFYARCGFSFERIVSYQDKAVLFMGKSL